PLFAILMTPFADPPRKHHAWSATLVVGAAGNPTGYAPLLAASALAASPAPPIPIRGRYLPYPVSVAVFYALSVVLLVVAVHLLVRAVEEQVPPADPAEAGRRWWRWRVGPVLAVAPAVGLTLMRGQVQTLLLLLVCGLIVGLLRGRR